MQGKKLTIIVVLTLSLALGASGIAWANSNPSPDQSINDQVKTHQFEHKRMPKHGQKGNWSDLQSILGVDSATLKQELKSGKSLAEIAQAKGISPTDLAAKMQASAEARIEQALKDGKITPEMADKIKANLKTRIEKAINYKHDPNQQKGECARKKNALDQSKTTEQPRQ